MKGHLHLNVRGMAVKARDLIESIQGLYSVLCHIPSHPPSRHLITTTTIIFIIIFIINMHSFPPYHPDPEPNVNVHVWEQVAS